MLGSAQRTAVALCSVAFLSTTQAACNNLCSGHGDCGADSYCECYANWMGSDCSQRVCGYTRAYINTPLGDLNGDGSIDMRINRRGDDFKWVTEAYDIEYGKGRGDPDGETEGLQWDEGHFYTECGSVGICDRDTGICNCFPGYGGAACQRTACPGRIDGEAIRDTVVCSGYGSCIPAYESLSTDYKLWDQASTTKCKCDPWYTGVDCSKRMCPIGIDSIGSTNRVTNRLQKISFPAYDIVLNATTAPWADFRARVNGKVLFTLTTEDVYGDTWTTSVNTLTYQTTCTDIAGKTCTVRPWFSQDILDDYVGEDGVDADSSGIVDAADTTALYGQNLLADQVNNSLQALPATNFPKGQTYVWMDYPLQGFQYPSSAFSSDATEYLNSPYTKFPDFTNAEELNCGRALDYVDLNGVDATEGLCLFVRGPYLTQESDLLTLRFSYRDGITDTATHADPTEAPPRNLWTGTSSQLTRDSSTMVASVSSYGTGLIASNWPFVTVEEVGHYRYWDTLEDGFPKMEFSRPEVAECSNRGLCNEYTGECDCLDGYSGRACDILDTHIDVGIIEF